MTERRDIEEEEDEEDIPSYLQIPGFGYVV